MALTGRKDMEIEILNKLSDKDLISYCSTNTGAREICNDQTFWQRRTISRYGKLVSNQEMNKYRGNKKWHDYYIELMKAEKDKHPEYLLAKSMENGRKDFEKILKNKGISIDFRVQNFPDGGKDESYVTDISKTGGFFPSKVGKYISYRPSGSKEMEGDYFYEKKNGEHIAYYENGKIDNVSNYKLVKEKRPLLVMENGIMTNRFEDQDVIISVLDGEQLKYNEDGKLILKEIFKEGKLINREFFE